jgi:hypothetical protein
MKTSAWILLLLVIAVVLVASQKQTKALGPIPAPSSPALSPGIPAPEDDPGNVPSDPGSGGGQGASFMPNKSAILPEESNPYVIESRKWKDAPPRKFSDQIRASNAQAQKQAVGAKRQAPARTQPQSRHKAQPLKRSALQGTYC